MSDTEIAAEELDATDGEEEFEPSFPKDIITLEHSFGYDCKRLFNLCLIDDDTLVFGSGNYIHYYSISRKEVTFRGTHFDAGIGFITKNEHPDYVGLLTIGENGPQPTVFVYEYPSHNVRVLLEGAAKALFTCGSYNSSGELFASQAGYPDYMLTIWRWEKAEVILRSKSFQNDVLHVHFSHFNPILLCSSGLSHVKFWKMANTFTGLKLQGDLGRFGKTDFSDIYAIYMLPDENVISGCEWGNMLLWEAGLIKFEICRKGRKPCHLKPITRITMDNNGEVMTVGMDGYVRIWYWETVDLADPPDDDRFVEIEPIYEFKIGDCEIRALQKIMPFDEKDFHYYAQDGNGGIWHCDLSTLDIPAKPKKIYTCHGGKVIAAKMSPISPHLMTLGEDGKIFVYDYEERKLLLEKQMISIGTDLIWLSTKVSKIGMELVASFADGIIRQLFLDFNSNSKINLHMVGVHKAHTAEITKMTINPSDTVLVTGAADMTIFVFNLTDHHEGFVHLKPMYFIKFDSVPSNFSWLPEKSLTILIGSKTGEVYEYDLPHKVTEEQVFLSYDLTRPEVCKRTKFVSIKSRIRRDLQRERIKKRKDLKRQRKMKEVEKLKAANPGLQIDLETALADSEPDEEEEPLFIPAKPNPIIWLRYTDRGTIWVSMAGYDAGYVYELKFGAAEPVRSTMIHDGDDCEIHSYLRIDDFLLFGLITGKIRVTRVNQEDFTDFKDYRVFNMHDALKGHISGILLSYDRKYLFSVGHDGNVFSYNWNKSQNETGSTPVVNIAAISQPITPVEDIDDPEYPSLEQVKIFAEIKRKEDAAAEHDRNVLEQIGKYQVKFYKIMHLNEALPEELRLQHRDMLLDERITRQIADELQAELEDVRDDLAYDLEVPMVGKTKLYNYYISELENLQVTLSSVGNNLSLNTFRIRKLGKDYQQMRADIEERLRMEAARERPTELTLAEEKSDSYPEPGVESFFFGRDPAKIIPRFNVKMLRLLRSYRTRQLYEIERTYSWEKLNRKKPNPNQNHPDDDEKIREAERTLGDYKMKIGYDYEPKKNETFTYKYIEIADNYEKYYNVLQTFNGKVMDLRKKKSELYEFLAIKRKRIDMIHRLLPKKNWLDGPNVPQIDINKEFPESNLIEHCKAGCGIEISDILYLEKHTKELLPKPDTKHETEKVMHFTTIMETIELERHHSLRVNEIDFVPEIDEMLNILNGLPYLDEPAYYESEGDEPSPWLIETRYLWLLRLMDEQQGVIYAMQNAIDKFDAMVSDLRNDRLYDKFNADFMTAYLVTLNQELMIMRDSEQIENHLLSNAEEAMKTRNQMQKVINSANRQMEESRKQSNVITDQISSIQLKFMSTIKGNKFFDFLRRIFKKKWKPIKPPKDNDETSESSSSDESSSEDEEDDTKSVDSTDMTAIRLDESTCPSGLERSTYDLAFKMRSDRHAMEKSLAEQLKIIDDRRKEVAELQKQMKYHEEVYAREKNTLLEFRRRRQQELNKVNIAVVLKMHQIQHFYDYSKFNDLNRAILFDSKRLIALQERADELKLETLETKRTYRINIVHLRRMNADIKFMRSEIVRLEALIEDAMMKKFGMIVPLDELEEEVLRKYVFDLETTAEEELRLIEEEMRRKTQELHNLQDELIRETQENCNKLNVLSVLIEERNLLETILASQEKNFEKWLKPPTLNLDSDIEKLLALQQQQRNQIQCLEREICTLRLKPRPLQLDTELEEMPPAAEQICPDMLAVNAYDMRLVPDEFAMDRIHTIVQKCFARRLLQHTSQEQIRKYAHRASRYLGQAAYSFQGEVTPAIMDCITENMQDLLPKKHFIHISKETLESLFHEVLTVLEYERSEVNTEDLISGMLQNALNALQQSPEVLNKTQVILESIFKELMEVMPPDEFQSEKTAETLVEVLVKEPLIDARCLSVEKLIDILVQYARENLLDGITAIPIRRLAETISREVVQRKRNKKLSQKSATSSVASVTISAKT